MHSLTLATLIASLTVGGVLAVGACLRGHPGRTLAAVVAALHRPVLLSGAMTGRQIVGTVWLATRADLHMDGIQPGDPQLHENGYPRSQAQAAMVRLLHGGGDAESAYAASRPKAP